MILNDLPINSFYQQIFCEYLTYAKSKGYKDDQDTVLLKKLSAIVGDLHIRSGQLLHNVVLQYYNRGKGRILWKHIGEALVQAWEGEGRLPVSKVWKQIQRVSR